MPIQPTVFDNGVSTLSEGMWNWFPYPSPHLFHTFFDDFNLFQTPDDWRVNATDIGNTSTGIIPGRGGLLGMTNSPANGDQHNAQYGADSWDMRFPARYYLYFRGFCSTWNQMNFAYGWAGAGLNSEDPTIDKFYFFKRAGQGIRFVSSDGVTAFSTDEFYFPADGDVIELAAFVDQNKQLTIYVFDKGVEKVNLNVVPNVLPNSAMRVTIYQRNGAAVANTLVVNTILASEEQF